MLFRYAPKRVVCARAAATSGVPSSNGAQRSGGTSADRVFAVTHQLPELVRATDAAGESAAQADHRDRLIQVTAVGLDRGFGGENFGAGQEPRQVGDRRVVPELDGRHFLAEQLGELAGEHNRVTRAQPQIAQRGVEVDVVGAASDIRDEVVGQPVP